MMRDIFGEAIRNRRNTQIGEDMSGLRVLSVVLHVATQEAYKVLYPKKIFTNENLRVRSNSMFSGVDIYRISLFEWVQLIGRMEVLLTDEYPDFLPIRSIFKQKQHLAEQVLQHLRNCLCHGAQVISIVDNEYPALLQAIDSPPSMLTVVGDVEQLLAPKVAVVGSRKSSPHALCEAYALGEILASKGFAVVSGGAFGCDIAAHKGVLASNKTPAPAIVVFAGGLSSLHPRSHAGIFREFSKRRATFVSERLWRTPSRPYDFPIRNRLISGMCMLLVVIEAGEKSGALLTANLALEQGRDVWVLKNTSDDVRAIGSNRLISDGANFFLSASEWS